MGGKIKLIGNPQAKMYSKVRIGNSLYYFPSKTGTTLIEYKGSSIKIESINLFVEKQNNLFVGEQINNFEFIFNERNDIFGEFEIVKKQNGALKFFISSFLKLFLYNFYRWLLLEIPTWALLYVQNQPIGIKQNTIIKESLGLVCSKALEIQRLIFLPAIFLNAEKVVLRINMAFIFFLYKTVLDRIIEIATLFNNKTYNSLKKRYDNVKLSIDQIVLCVLFFSISTLTLITLVFYYLLYLVFYFIVLFLKAFEMAVCLFILVGSKNTGEFNKETARFQTVSSLRKMVLIAQYLYPKMSYREVLRGDLAV
ncbi:hypothetical protein NGRA_2417 [Nosema granulosis]|uniref:Uncharacterized protein n=1 Tax=Nosema granulosis TaxID=83296 RepID=A0A9P6GXI5_9MICR|nr:hypothetical protein NGRA_2417 [Nosema granulosis]